MKSDEWWSQFRLAFALYLMLLFVPPAVAQPAEPPTRFAPILTGNVSRYEIDWNADSTRLIFQAGTRSSGLSGFEHDTNTGELIKLDYSPFTLTMTDEQMAFFQADHRWSHRDPYSGERVLMLWEAEKLIDALSGRTIYTAKPKMPVVYGDLVGAGLMNDPDSFLYIDETGLHAFDREHNFDIVIDPEINSNWVKWANFSPDSRHVAVYSQRQLFVLPLAVNG